jgi:FAD/FMN-containing dehydrogenase
MRPELYFPESESMLRDVLLDLGRRELTEPRLPGTAATGPLVTGSAAPDPIAALADFSVAQGEPTGVGSGVISTSRLADVVSFRPRDLTIEVGAGMRMRELVRFVEARSLWLPVSGAGLERSVGGWIAAASPGAWDASFGPVRRQLLGCRMLTPSGESLTWGRAVMKNVAGFDIPRLMAGSRGRLGVMTTVTLRLWPRPESISVHEIAGGDPGDRLEWTEAEAVTWHWSSDLGDRQAVVFAGGAESVRRRRAALGERADTAARESVSDCPSRAPRSVVYRLTPGRRYLPTAFAALTRDLNPGLAAIEAWPATGSMLVRFDSGQEPGTPEPSSTAAVERGGPEAHARVAALRDPAALSIESEIERVFGAWPRSWLADYL